MHFQVIFHSAEFFYIKRRIVEKFSMLKYILKVTLRKNVKQEIVHVSDYSEFYRCRYVDNRKLAEIIGFYDIIKRRNYVFSNCGIMKCEGKTYINENNSRIYRVSENKKSYNSSNR